jgi:hypothetical protein
MLNNDTKLVIIAIVAAIGLLGLVVVETINVQQQQEAFARVFTWLLRIQ